MITVVSVFGTCWLPMHAYFALTQLRPDFRQNAVYLVCFQVAMSNSACNPLIYYRFNRRFRCCVLYLLHWLPGLRARRILERYIDIFWAKDEPAGRKGRGPAARGPRTPAGLGVGPAVGVHASVDCVGTEVVALNYSNMMLKRRRESSSDSYVTDEFVGNCCNNNLTMSSHLSLPLGFGMDAATRNAHARSQWPRLPTTVRVPSGNLQEEDVEMEIEAEPASSY